MNLSIVEQREIVVLGAINRRLQEPPPTTYVAEILMKAPRTLRGLKAMVDYAVCREGLMCAREAIQQQLRGERQDDLAEMRALEASLRNSCFDELEKLRALIPARLLRAGWVQ